MLISSFGDPYLLIFEASSTNQVFLDPISGIEGFNVIDHRPFNKGRTIRTPITRWTHRTSPLYGRHMAENQREHLLEVLLQRTCTPTSDRSGATNPSRDQRRLPKGTR